MPAFTNKYKIIQKIGEGSFSEVLKCEDRTNKEFYAAKILKKIFQNTSDVFFCAEIIAMQKLGRHPNVLYMHEYFFEKSSGKLIFVFELMDMSMYEFMKVKKRCIPELKVKNYLYQMLKGLDYLHKHGLFHRDIKPENILVRLRPEIFLQGATELIKLADLGSIRGIYSKPPYTEYISTRWYRSPECLLTVGHYGPKMDIWATGCVFYEMLTMKPLFPGANEIDQLTKIHAILGTPSTRLISKLKSRSRNLQNFTKQIGTGLTPLITNFTEDGQTMLKLMLQYDPDIRSNARRLLQHKYFINYREEERHKKINKQYIGKEYGDTPMEKTEFKSSSDKFKCSKFQSNSMRSVCEKKKTCPLFNSKTSVELTNRNSESAALFLPKRSLKTFNSNSDPQSLNKRLDKSKLKINNTKRVFRNTTSNLLDTSDFFDVQGAERVVTPSCMSLTKRAIAKDQKLPDAKRHKI